MALCDTAVGCCQYVIAVYVDTVYVNNFILIKVVTGFFFDFSIGLLLFYCCYYWAIS